ncbi:MAG: tyrosine-type recombinase/integrase [Longicatena sp.]
MIDTTIPVVHPHLFRNSYGALMYREGLSRPEVAKLMGHEQLSTTKIYAETNIDMIKESLFKISRSDIKK